MKKLTYPLLIGLMAVVLTACGSNDEAKKANDEEKTKTAQTEQQKQEKQMEEMQKKLDKQKIDEKKTVAIVNNKKILGSDYNDILLSSQMQMQQMGQDPTSEEAAKQVKKQTIDTLVGQTLLLQDADKKGYKASDSEIEKELAETKKQFKDDKKFKAAMKEAGINMTELKKQISQNIIYKNYLDKEIPIQKVTDKEIEDYYNQSVKKESNNTQETPKLADVKPQIKQQLEQQKIQQNVGKQVEELKKNSTVEVKV
ncbi:SurA N-terminal domain-containing protein [Bacillus sp. V59.32b]|uniref:SurA N-terminal domain-containing protein n=1 Tax=Bacillus sp. V59.32b TaxID=1758642 RepID=UPI000E3D341A|nr:SurA N-terminal domain-containing protein [Bacillus sp. V59.32b]RFU62712.1 peptidylprolyl isomerase [Bacillus sp. V59.32b]